MVTAVYQKSSVKWWARSELNRHVSDYGSLPLPVRHGPSEDAEVLLHLGLIVKHQNHPIFQRWFGLLNDVRQRHGLNLMDMGSVTRFHVIVSSQ